MRKQIGYAALTAGGIIVGVMLFTNLIAIGLIADFTEPNIAVQTDDPTVTYEITEWDSPVYSDEKERYGKMYIQPADNRRFAFVYDEGTVYGTEQGVVLYDEENAGANESTKEETPLKQRSVGPVSDLNQSEFAEIQNHWSANLRWTGDGTVDTPSNKLDDITLSPYSDNKFEEQERKNRVSVGFGIPRVVFGPYNANAYEKDLTLNRVTVHDRRPALVYTNITRIRPPPDYDELIKPVGRDSLVFNKAGQDGITVERSDRIPQEVFENETQINPTEVKKIEQPSQVGTFKQTAELVNKSVLRTDDDMPLAVNDVSGQQVPSKDVGFRAEYQSSGKPITAAIPIDVSPAYKHELATIWDNLDTTAILDLTNVSANSGTGDVNLEYSSRSYITYYDRSDGNVAYAYVGLLGEESNTMTVSYTQSGDRKSIRQQIANPSHMAVVELPCEEEPCRYQNITIQHHETTGPNGTVPVRKQPKLYKYVQMDVTNNGYVRKSYREFVGDYRFSEYATVDIFDPEYQADRFG